MQSFDFDFEGNYPLTNEQVKALLSLKYPLDYLYQEWLNYDGSVLDTLRQSNDLAIKSKRNILKHDPKKIRKVDEDNLYISK